MEDEPVVGRLKIDVPIDAALPGDSLTPLTFAESGNQEPTGSVFESKPLPDAAVALLSRCTQEMEPLHFSFEHLAHRALE